MRFNYVAWRYFLEHLQSSRGGDRFHELLVAFLDDAGAVHPAFQRIYGMSVNDAVREFQQDLRLGIWAPL
jgi:hypothetical protein